MVAPNARNAFPSYIILCSAGRHAKRVSKIINGFLAVWALYIPKDQIFEGNISIQ